MEDSPEDAPSVFVVRAERVLNQIFQHIDFFMRELDLTEVLNWLSEDLLDVV